MKIEFINFNDDPRLNPEVKRIAMSQDGKNAPPSYCLPWVEVSRYSIQLKSNFEYWIRKGKKTIEACAVKNGKILPAAEVFAQLPEGVPFLPRNEQEARENKIRLSYAPSFSSAWQAKRRHSVTLKLGICWWTPPGWGLLFTSAVHQNEEFRVVEGFVRTDLWHRDIPIVIQPLVEEVRIPKYKPLVSAFLVPAEDLELVSAAGDREKLVQLANQTSKKRLDKSIYKKLVLGKKKSKAGD